METFALGVVVIIVMLIIALPVFLAVFLAIWLYKWANKRSTETGPKNKMSPPPEKTLKEGLREGDIEQKDREMAEMIRSTDNDIARQVIKTPHDSRKGVVTSAAIEPEEKISPEFSPLRSRIEAARQEVAKQVFGMESMLDQCMIALLSGGHVLCEGLPGLAKTTLAKTFAKVVSCRFKRCQFSPDLLPSDLLGDRIFNQKTDEFDFREGPVFTQILLADEINRAPAKTQAALLEVMQEAQVTIFGEQHLIGAVENTDSRQQNNRIFFAIATQNPIEQEGTYRLPEAQLDRFMFRLFFQWPERNDELAILGLENGSLPPPITPCFTAAEILEWREKIARDVNAPEKIKEAIVDLMRATRVHKDILVGAGPRACQVLLRGAKVRAAMRGSDTVAFSDIRALAFDALNHRIVLKPDVIFDHPELSPLDVMRDIIDSTLDGLQKSHE